MAPPQRVLGSNHRNRWKICKNLLLQNHLPQMLEIRYVALPSGPIPSLFKSRSEGSKWPYARGSWFWSIEIHQYYEKNLLFQNHLAQMLEIWYKGFHSRALLSLLKWWPKMPNSSAALGFEFELLNSGKRLRAIMEFWINAHTGHTRRDKRNGILWLAWTAMTENSLSICSIGSGFPASKKNCNRNTEEKVTDYVTFSSVFLLQIFFVSKTSSRPKSRQLHACKFQNWEVQEKRATSVDQDQTAHDMSFLELNSL